MKNQIQTVPAPPVLTIVNDHVTTTSLEVARVFEKRHDNVIQGIRALEVPGDLRLLNFKESIYINDQGREQPMFTMTKDGFVFLAMGFTGKKAAQFKWAYIEAFNKMEAELARQAAGTFPAIPMKFCLKCRSEKPTTEFWAHRKHRDKLQSWCKKCMDTFNKRRPVQAQIECKATVPAPIDETALAIRISEEIMKRLPAGAPGLRSESSEGVSPEEWKAAWEKLCETHGMVYVAVNRLYDEVRDLTRGSKPVSPGQDPLNYIRGYYNELANAAQQINILEDVLMWRSPRVSDHTMHFSKTPDFKPTKMPWDPPKPKPIR